MAKRLPVLMGYASTRSPTRSATTRLAWPDSHSRSRPRVPICTAGHVPVSQLSTPGHAAVGERRPAVHLGRDCVIV
eukprot:304231-Rhodomonas_salina.4